MALNRLGSDRDCSTADLSTLIDTDSRAIGGGRQSVTSAGSAAILITSPDQEGCSTNG